MRKTNLLTLTMLAATAGVGFAQTLPPAADVPSPAVVEDASFRELPAASGVAGPAVLPPPLPPQSLPPIPLTPPFQPTRLQPLPAGPVDDHPAELQPPRLLTPVPSPTDLAPDKPTVPLPVNDPPGVKAFGFGGPYWTRVEYLLWTSRNAPLSSPLITTTTSSSSSSGIPSTSSPDSTSDSSSSSGTSSVPSSGSSSGTSTVALVGGNGIGFGNYDGPRLTIGRWLNPEQTWGLEASAFWTTPLSQVLTISGASQSSGTLTRPFGDAQSGNGVNNIIAQAGNAVGSVQFAAHSRLWGGEVNALSGFWRDGHGLCWDWSLGARYLELAEDIAINQFSFVEASGVFSFNGVPVNPPSGLGIADHFQTRNQFFGTQIGVRSEYRWEPLFINWNTGVALGINHQTAVVTGNTTFVNPGVQTTAGGLLAVPTNMGHFNNDGFAAIPQLGINLGFLCGDWLRVSVGYDFLYFTSVVRPGDQINLAINQTQVPSSTLFGPFAGPALPNASMQQRDFWIQGINFAVEVHF